MNKSISNIDETSFYLKVNVFSFNPCREWLILKLKIKGLYVDFHLICNKLLYKGVTNEELADVSTKILDMMEKSTTEDRIVEIILRYVKSQRANKGIDEGF